MTWVVAVLAVGAIIVALNWDDGRSSGQDPATATTAAPSPTTSTPRTTTTVFSAFQGWVVGACVDFIGELAEPIGCNRPHDAEVIDIVQTEAECPLRTEWLVDLDGEVACLVET